jgi:hypothetical protein
MSKAKTKAKTQVQQIAERIHECLAAIGEQTEQAGKLAVELVRLCNDNELTAYEVLCRTRFVHRNAFDRLLRVGRQQLHPRLFAEAAPFAEHAQWLPYEEQKRLLEGQKIDVTQVTGTGEILPRPLRKLARELSYAECLRVFAATGRGSLRKCRLRTHAEQTVWEQQRIQSEARRANNRQSWYTVSPDGQTLRIHSPRTVRREHLARMLLSIARGSGASAITSDEWELHAFYDAQRAAQPRPHATRSSRSAAQPAAT